MSVDRRQFMRRFGAGLASGVLGSALPAAPLARRRRSPNERIGLGLIGVGSLGRGHHLRRALEMPDFEVLALADVDRRHLDGAVGDTEGKAQGYQDYRHLLDRADVEAVIIVTPDHWHALQVVHACEAGKDVYCEKPLSLTVAEGRAMVGAARRYGRVVQTGTQQRSDARFRWACELVRGGLLGRIRRVRAVLGQGPTASWEPERTPPPELAWDFWLGPAPWRPYQEKRCHYTFRWFEDYSGGKMTDWGAHHLDIVQWALGTELSGPLLVEGSAANPADNLYESPVDFDVHYTYPGGVQVHATGSGENGITFYGDAGEVFVSRSRIGADPPEILETKAGTGPVVLEESADHHRNWVECLRTRRRPISDVEIGHRSATVCHLGNIAIRMERQLKWDAVAERFEGDEAANRCLTKPMRPPWSL